MPRFRCFLPLLLGMIWLTAVDVAPIAARLSADVDSATLMLIDAVSDDDPVKGQEALNAGGNARISDSKWGNLVHGAKSAAMINLLVSNGADVNSRGRRGKTPLYVAVDKGQAELVTALLAAGADPLLLKDKSNKPLIHIAAKEGHLDIVRALLAYQGMHEIAANDGATALHYAAKGGYTDIVALLLEHKADPNAPGEDLTTPLHLAATADIVALLVKAGAYIDIRNNKGATPLHFAVAKKRPEVLAALLRAGADAHAQLDGGATALNLLDKDILTIHRILNEYGVQRAATTEDPPLKKAVLKKPVPKKAVSQKAALKKAVLKKTPLTTSRTT
jgi:ankyrin repeat protein